MFFRVSFSQGWPPFLSLVSSWSFLGRIPQTSSHSKHIHSHCSHHYPFIDLCQTRILSSARSLSPANSGLIYANYLRTATLKLVQRTLQSKVPNSMTFTLRPAPFSNQARHHHSLQSLPQKSSLTPFSPSLSQSAAMVSLTPNPSHFISSCSPLSHLDNCFSSGFLPSFIFLNSILYTATEKTVLKYRSDHVISLLKSFQWLLSWPTEPYYLACASFLPHLSDF